MIRNLKLYVSVNDAVAFIPAAERTVHEDLDAAQMASWDSSLRMIDCNHIFLNIIPTVYVDVEDVQKTSLRSLRITVHKDEILPKWA